MKWINKSALLLYLIIIFSVAATYAEEMPVVLFDQGHGQRFLADRNEILDLSGLAALFAEKGFAVRTGRETFSDALLTDVDAVVISGAFKAFSPEEISVLVRFIRKGGRLSVMLHIGPPAGDLLHTLGVDISNGVIRERQGIVDSEPLNFKVTHLKPHELTNGLKQFSLYGGWALINSDDRAEVIAETGPTAWVDLNGDKKFSPGDAAQSFGVVVVGNMGKGKFVIFGDDAIFQNKFLVDDNLLLGKSLVEWID